METLALAAASACILLSPFFVVFGCSSENAAERVASGEAVYTLRSADLPCAE